MKVLRRVILPTSFALLILLSTPPLLSQTCTQPFTLRQEVCPSGISTCSTKASTLTYQELDRDIINTVNICNGPGKWIWPSDSAGVFTSNGSGTISIGNLTGDVVTSGFIATIQPNSIGLATDTVGNYAAGDAEAGNATGLVCTTCVGTTDIANDSVTYAKIQNVTSGTLLGRSTAGSGDVEEITVGTNLTLSGGTLSASGGGSAPDTLTTPVLGDEFCTRHAAENVYGDLGWRLYGSNATSISGDTSHPCIQSLFTTTVSGNIQSIGLSSNSDTDLFRPADIDRVSFLIKVNSVSNVEYRMGLMDQVDSTTGGDGFFIELDTSASAAWRCITRQSGTTTATNNGAGSVVIDTWYLLEIERDMSNNHKCYVNGVSFATHTTNLPTGLYNGGLMVQTNDTVQKILYIDAFRAKFKTLTRY